MRSFTSSVLGVAALFTAQAVAQTPYEVQTPPLTTDWTFKVGTNPWPEYPRPQLVRENWQSLNGLWTWRAAKSPDDVSTLPAAGPLDREVLVPACIESGLSGLQITDVRDFWYETTFEVPADWEGQQILLNFEAVDYEATVFVNGEKVTNHVGGYIRFTIDVTDKVAYGASNDLLVFVSDPTDSANIPVGKQSLKPSHIFYRSCSGIWQQVWIEAAPKDHIARLDVAANADGQVTVNVTSSAQAGSAVSVKVHGPNGTDIGTGSGTSDKEFTFNVKGAKLWSPDTPNLYNLTVTLGDDKVNSYTGFRTISRGKVEDVERFLLNGEFVFQFGTLDQGFWPDGLHTPPNREAMVSDLKVLKDLGFNMVRKHIKVEPDLFYQACDQLGLLVIQDMPALTPPAQPNAEEQAAFQRQLEIMINEHKSYPSIATWVIYNEGWGQPNQGAPWPEEGLTQVVRNLDASRLIDSVTGWNDHGFGDYHDKHNYAGPQCGVPWNSLPNTPNDNGRIAFQGEFGGLGHNVTIDHLWNVAQAVDAIDETYEVHETLESYNYRASDIFRQLREQTELYSCSGAVYTQTTDVEGEVNGLLTYDRRVLRPNVDQWKKDIQSFYTAAAKRGGRPVSGKY